MRRMPALWVLLCVLALAACAPRFGTPLPAPGPDGIAPAILAADDVAPAPGTGGPERVRFRMADGTMLMGRHWAPGAPEGQEKGIILGLHGMGDYSNAFAGVGAFLAEQGYRVYAYDQRGFGETPERGRWPGEAALTADLGAVARLLRARHPDRPLRILGLSMGASVALAAMGGPEPPPVDGLVLAAPATWGWSTLPFLYRAALWVGARVFPSRAFTGKGLEIWPSDNIEMLRAYARDPLVVKGTRTDAIYGLVDLMDSALRAAPEVRAPVFVVYGAKDEIVPKKPVKALLRALPGPKRYAFYEQGYHMLLRDLGRRTVWQDIAAHLEDPRGPLPSGAEAAIPGEELRRPALARLSRD